MKQVVAAWRSFRADGWGATTQRGKTFIAQRWLGVRPDLTQHRYVLSERICGEFDFTVAYGPLAGLRLDPQSWWSAADRGAMILGLYERQVLDALVRICDGSMSLVDVGAADGYYAIGAVKAGLVPRAVCFEISEEGQAVIANNAERNGVARSIEVRGEAGVTFLEQVPERDWSPTRPAVFLFDIEGGEFDLLTDAILAQLRNSYVIVEVHETQGISSGRAESLIARTRESFNVEVLGTGPRDPGAIPELRSWPDDDRWLLVSESRQYDMRWLILSPKSHGQE